MSSYLVERIAASPLTSLTSSKISALDGEATRGKCPTRGDTSWRHNRRLGRSHNASDMRRDAQESDSAACAMRE
jgi:hypothetical protein